MTIFLEAFFLFFQMFLFFLFILKINFQNLLASNLTVKNIMNFEWRTSSVHEEADAKIWDFLLTFSHTGRGSELPEDDQKTIAGKPANLACR